MTEHTSKNDTLFARAQKTTPGGVNSPVRAFRSVGGTPRFITRAEGPYFWDADGKRYIDYIGSWGPAIVGHAHPEVVKAVQEAAARGLSFGAPTEGEIEMAEEICRLVPSIEQVRLVSSGTEATMSALRLARGATGRDKIVKFEGCYHGHADSLLVKAGSGLLTFGNPTSAGVPEDFVKHTLVLDYNNVAQLEDAFDSMGDTIACVIVEPVAGNMNLIKATPGIPAGACATCAPRHGAVLIFDEVMCGFRVGLGGAQEMYDIQPDLTALGKVIGGGMPVAAFGGRADLMHNMAPIGAVYQAGTLSGNPVAVAAGMATLKLIQEPGFYDKPVGADGQAGRGPGRSGEGSRRHLLRRLGGRHVRHLLQRRSPDQLRRDDGGRQDAHSTPSSTACSTKACTSRRPRSKPASSRRSTTTA